MVGPGRLELPTSRLSGVRSNHLSYGPARGNTNQGLPPNRSALRLGIGTKMAVSNHRRRLSEEKETKAARGPQIGA